MELCLIALNSCVSVSGWHCCYIERNVTTKKSCGNYLLMRCIVLILLKLRSALRGKQLCFTQSST